MNYKLSFPLNLNDQHIIMDILESKYDATTIHNASESNLRQKIRDMYPIGKAKYLGESCYVAVGHDPIRIHPIWDVPSSFILKHNLVEDYVKWAATAAYTYKDLLEIGSREGINITRLLSAKGIRELTGFSTKMDEDQGAQLCQAQA